jgi:hypothetical protein
VTVDPRPRSPEGVISTESTGPREPCPCGSGKRFKACHGKPGGAAAAFVARPFAGLPGECDWVALREVVPSAVAPLRLRDGRTATLATVLPVAWAALRRADGGSFVALQTTARSGDVSRDIAWALEQVLAAEPGTPIVATGLPGEGARLQDLLDDSPLAVDVRTGFEFWVDGVEDPTGEIAASLERANAAAVPTERLAGVEAAYWCQIRETSHLRWVLHLPEEEFFDAAARLHVAGSLDLGAGTRFVGTFRAHGLVVPVWDLVPGTDAAATEPLAAALLQRLEEARTSTGPLDSDQRRARAGLVSRQLTLR